MMGIRTRLRGRKASLFVERHRYRLHILKVKRRKRFRRRSYVPPFRISEEERPFVKIIKGRDKNLVVGAATIRVSKGSLVITLPEIFDFQKNYEDSARVIAIFRRALEAKRKISYIDFEKLKEISSSCIMVFSAYADMWKCYAPNVKTKTQTWLPSIARKFADIGFFKMLGFTEPVVNCGSYIDQEFMPLEAKVVMPSEKCDIGAIAGGLQERIEKYFGISLGGVRMYDSVTEAIYNVHDHAYRDLKHKSLPFKWWFSVAYSREENELTVMIFDHGLGIPATIKTSNKFSSYHRYISKWSDAARLYLAFERERRRTGGPGLRSLINGRGHGCPDIARLISPNDENEVKESSRLSVISGRGQYVLKWSDKDGRGDKNELAVKLQGTLIEWRIKL